MPTKREIEFNFMGLKLTDVVQDLNVEWEFRFLSWLLAMALNQKDTLERLPYQEWIFPVPTADVSNISCSLLSEMITGRSLALDISKTELLQPYSTT